MDNKFDSFMDNAENLKSGKIEGFNEVAMPFGYTCRTYEDLEHVYHLCAAYFFEAEEVLRDVGYTDEECLLMETDARNTFKRPGKEN